MELGTVVAILALVAIVGIGVWFVAIAVVALAYGRFYHDAAERDGRARYFRPGVRACWLGPLLRWVFRFELDERAQAEKPVGPEPALFVCRPHGLLTVSAWLTFLLDGYAQPHRRVLLAVHSYWFVVPGVRELALLLGCIDVSRDSIVEALAHGFSVAVMPGGIREMGPPVVPQPATPGVVRIAEEFQVPLVPVLFTGEPDLFWYCDPEPRPVAAARSCCIRRCRLPLPLPCFPRCCWRRPRLRAVFGTTLWAFAAWRSEAALAVRLKKEEERLLQECHNAEADGERE